MAMQTPFGKLRSHDGARRLLVRVVADDAAVAPASRQSTGPLMHLVADGRFAEEDAAIRRDIEIVGEPETGNRR